MSRDTDITAKVQQIALYLGRPWKYDHQYDSIYAYQIKDGTGRALHVSTWEKGKFKISGMFPANKTGRNTHRDDHKTIGVSRSRDAKAIAADIERRLLPHYLERFNLAVARHKEDCEAQALKKHMMEAVRKVAPGGRIHTHGRYDNHVYFEKGSAQFRYDNRIDLELRELSPELAIRILGMLHKEQG